jgi:hypothetical protein
MHAWVEIDHRQLLGGHGHLQLVAAIRALAFLARHDDVDGEYALTNFTFEPNRNDDCSCDGYTSPVAGCFPKVGKVGGKGMGAKTITHRS